MIKDFGFIQKSVSSDFLTFHSVWTRDDLQCHQFLMFLPLDILVSGFIYCIVQ